MCNIILVARVPTIHKTYVWPRMVNDVQIFIVSEGIDHGYALMFMFTK